MITAIDTNILVALWEGDADASNDLRETLDNASQKGGVSICGTVFAELLASSHVTESFIDKFCSDARISIDWVSNEAIWRTAGLAYGEYARNRRRQKSGQPRRILADFVIGAHALINGHSLLTLDARIYRAAFPKLSLIQI